MWILPAPGIEPVSLPWQADSYLFLRCTTREVSTIECYKTQYLIILCTSSWITPILPGREHWVSSRTTEQLMPQGFTEMSSYFSQILKADLNNLKFPRDSILLQYMDDLLLCSLSQASSQESRIHSLKLLVLIGYKIEKKKNLQFVQTQVQYLGHLIWEQCHT